MNDHVSTVVVLGVFALGVKRIGSIWSGLRGANPRRKWVVGMRERCSL